MREEKKVLRARMIVLGSMLALASGSVLAQDADLLDHVPMDSEGIERDPAAIRGNSGKRTYPGGMDEEDLRVQSQIAEAPVRVDARSLQKEVYKKLYNAEMKDDRQEMQEE